MEYGSDVKFGVLTLVDDACIVSTGYDHLIDTPKMECRVFTVEYGNDVKFGVLTLVDDACIVSTGYLKKWMFQR